MAAGVGGADSSPTQRTTAWSCVSTAIASFGSATSKIGATMHSWSSVRRWWATPPGRAAPGARARAGCPSQRAKRRSELGDHRLDERQHRCATATRPVTACSTAFPTCSCHGVSAASSSPSLDDSPSPRRRRRRRRRAALELREQRVPSRTRPPSRATRPRRSSRAVTCRGLCFGEFLERPLEVGLGEVGAGDVGAREVGAGEKVAPARLALSKMAPARLAPARAAPSRFAPLGSCRRFALWSSAFCSSPAEVARSASICGVVRLTSELRGMRSASSGNPPAKRPSDQLCTIRRHRPAALRFPSP